MTIAKFLGLCKQQRNQKFDHNPEETLFPRTSPKILLFLSKHNSQTKAK